MRLQHTRGRRQRQMADLGGDKSNEIVAIPAQLEFLAIEGAVVIVDASGCCQRAISRENIDEIPIGPRDAVYQPLTTRLIALSRTRALRSPFIQRQKVGTREVAPLQPAQTVEGDIERATVPSTRPRQRRRQPPVGDPG